MATNKGAQHQPHNNHPDQTWTHQKNQNKGQYQTRECIVSHDVCPAHG